MNTRWTLKDKKVLITGGTKGIGNAIVKEFLNFNAEIIIIARSQKDIDKQIKK